MKTYVLMVLSTVSLVICCPAAGGVIYHWQQLDPAPHFSSSSGVLEITDAAYRRGFIEYDSHARSATLADSPVLEFTFGNDTQSPVYFHPADLADSRFGGFLGSVVFSVEFTTAGLIVGDIHANDTESDVGMSAGIDGIWNIDRFGSDNAATGCFLSPQCSGATGRWILDPSTAPGLAVPEPGPLPLLLAGAMGILWLGRRRLHFR